MTFLTILLCIVAGGVLSATMAGFEARRELALFRLKDSGDRMAILVISVVVGTILGGIGGAIFGNTGSVSALLGFSVFTCAVVFVCGRIARFCQWLNRTVDQARRPNLD